MSKKVELRITQPDIELINYVLSWAVHRAFELSYFANHNLEMDHYCEHKQRLMKQANSMLDECIKAKNIFHDAFVKGENDEP